MLRVRLEIVPYGVEELTYEIGRLDIFNTGLVMPELHSMRNQLCTYGVIETSQGSGGLYDAEIEHDRSLGAWELVRKAIHDLGIASANKFKR